MASFEQVRIAIVNISAARAVKPPVEPMLAKLAGDAGGSSSLCNRILAANTTAEALSHAQAEGIALGDAIAHAAWEHAAAVVAGKPIDIEIAIFDRDGRLVGHAPPRAAHLAPPRKRRR